MKIEGDGNREHAGCPWTLSDKVKEYNLAPVNADSRTYDLAPHGFWRQLCHRQPSGSCWLMESHGHSQRGVLAGLV